MTTDHIYVKNAQQLHEWLMEHHATSSGVWLVFEKGPGRQLHIDEIVDELLCFGWVDSVVGKVDDTRTKLYISPRNPKSNWSKVNKEKISRLEAQGRLMPAGLRMVEIAKQTGTWTALDGVERLEIPHDLQKELARYPDAATHFAAFPRSAKRGILEWIHTAKRPETRTKRIQETARLAQDNIRALQRAPTP